MNYCCGAPDDCYDQGFVDYSDFMAALSSDPTSAVSDTASYEEHVQERLAKHIAFGQANQHLGQPWRADPRE